MTATRRNFFLKAGTALSLPLAGAAAAEDVRPDPVDDVTSIRRLQQALAREIAAGRPPEELAEVTRIRPADFGAHDIVAIAADGRTARATFHCSVETRVPIPGAGTLIEMARAQGEGFVRSTNYKMLEMVCVRTGRIWKIDTLAMRDA